MSRLLVQFKQVSFAYPGWKELLLENISFSIYQNERVGLLGYNGTGKTTLLDLIEGAKEPEKGEILNFCDNIFHLKQEDYAQGNTTVLNYLIQGASKLHNLYEKIKDLEKSRSTDSMEYAEAVNEFYQIGGYEYLKVIEKNASAFGLSQDDLLRNLNTLSGGEKRILKILSGFIKKYDLYLFDEPTNYLDDRGMEILILAINSSPSTFVIVSHDRWFLDQTVKKIIEIEQKTIHEYRGNYSTFYKVKHTALTTKLRKIEKIEKEIKHLKDIAHSYRIWGLRKEKEKIGAGDKGFVSHRAAKLLKRVKTSEDRIQKKIVELEQTKPYIEKYYKFWFEKVAVPKGACLSVNLLTKRFGNKVLFENLSFTIDWGEKVAISGPNGSGKTTLLKIILGREKADFGKIIWSRFANIGYLSQTWEQEDDSYTIDELFTEEQKEKANDLIGTLKVMAMGNVFPKKLGELSEGQKRKIKIVRLILSNPNVLIFDEPTTHLDYQTVEFLEKALMEYNGTLILISHDRFLRERTTTRMINI